tara:strand:+ start:159 stop:422 length:264 start_codon:yes stop_codon:yes gene_type:complete
MIKLKDLYEGTIAGKDTQQVKEAYKYNPSIPAHVLLIQISNAMADLRSKNILAKVAKMNPDAKRKAKEVDKIVNKAITALDELADMV